MPCSRRLTVIGLILFCAAAANAQYVDITRPGDPIQVVNGSDDGDGSAGDPPPSEVPAKAIDDFAQKYLNFKDLGSGFAVTPSANPLNLPVIGLRFYTANDFPSRDPASYILEGSNDSIAGPWVLISQGPLALPADRNTTTTDAIRRCCSAIPTRSCITGLCSRPSRTRRWPTACRSAKSSSWCLSSSFPSLALQRSRW
jgi:hypothetical protein